MSKADTEQLREYATAQEWAKDALRFHFDVAGADDIDAINGGVFRFTSCGASVTVNKQAELVFVSIVGDGSAEFECDPVSTEGRTQAEISSDITEALQWLEEESYAAWHETNG